MFISINAFILGLAAGSFANVLVWRLPRGGSIVRPRSRCPSCHAAISWFDNIPLLSYVLLGGRCRRCRVKIPWRYPLIEVFSGVLYLAAFRVIEPRGLADFAGAYLFFPSLVAVAAIDWEHGVIPDRLILPSAAAALAWSFVPGDGVFPLPAFLAAAAGSAVFFAIAWLYRGSLGGGDVKLMVFLGAILGPARLLTAVLIGSTTGAILGVALIALRLRRRRDPIPYGPFLVLGAITALFLDADFLHRVLRGWG